MRFFRFSNNDNNYSLNRFGEFGGHQWTLPLRAKNSSVALTSLTIKLYKESSNLDLPDVLIVKCNLLERGMQNQSGVLKTILMKRFTRNSTVYAFETSFPGYLFYIISK